jgi:MSHA biogenesis protein MshP
VSSRRNQRGVALLAAIFLLVVLGGLTAYMVSLSASQHSTSMWAVQGARAHYAAQSGLQWGAAQLAAGQPCAPEGIPIDGGAGVMFTVTIRCTDQGPFTELATTRTVWLIDVVASRGGAVGNPGYVQRKQLATVVVP